MYSKKDIQSIYHAMPELRRIFTPAMNAENSHVKPSALFPDPPLIGTTWKNGRYVLTDSQLVNKDPVSEYFYDPFGNVRAYDAQYTDKWFIIDEENKVDANGNPIVFEYPYGWNKEDIQVLNNDFFTYVTILKHLNDAFITQLNRLRMKHGLETISVDEGLYTGSIIRTREAADSGYVHPEHIRPDDTPYHSAFKYKYPNPQSVVGENQIAIPYNGNVYTILHPAVISFAMKEWENSPEHLDNFLYPDYKKAYITIQMSQRSPWIKEERTAYFTPSVYLTCHLATE